MQRRTAKVWRRRTRAGHRHRLGGTQDGGRLKQHNTILEHSGSGVELRTLGYEDPGSNPGCGVKTLGKFFHSTLLQLSQLNK